MSTTTEQQSLLASLARRNSTLARIYRGGLAVLAEEPNPCRFELTAHSMRELIEKCPLLIGGDAVSTGDTMKNRLEAVRQAYFTVTRDQGFNESSPLAVLEGPLRALLTKLAIFVKWQDDNRPKAKERTAKMLEALSGPGHALPVDTWNNEVARWMDADEYFKKVAHYGQENVDRDEFLRHMTFVENVLLRRLQPRAVSGHDALDALIQEGEYGH